MNAQLSLVWSASYAGGQAWIKQLEAISAAVYYLTPKEVAHELDIGGSVLSEAIKETRDRRWAASWTPVLLAMLRVRRDRGDEVAARMLRAIVEVDVEISGLDLVDTDEVTPDEVVAALTPDERKRANAKARAARRKR